MLKRLLKPSFTLKIVVWLVVFAISLAVALIFDITQTLFIIFLATNYFIFEIITPIANLIAKLAERNGKQPSIWFVADVKREKKHFGPLRANRLFGHPLGKKK